MLIISTGGQGARASKPFNSLRTRLKENVCLDVRHRKRSIKTWRLPQPMTRADIYIPFTQIGDPAE